MRTKYNWATFHEGRSIDVYETLGKAEIDCSIIIEKEGLDIEIRRWSNYKKRWLLKSEDDESFWTDLPTK